MSEPQIMVAKLRQAAQDRAKTLQMLSDAKSERNQAAGDVGASYSGPKLEELFEWRVADYIESVMSKSGASAGPSTLAVNLTTTDAVVSRRGEPEFIEWLQESVDRAREDLDRSSEIDQNAAGTAYDSGYLDALLAVELELHMTTPRTNHGDA